MNVVKRFLGGTAALAGLIIAVWLVMHENPGAVIALMRTAGWGLSIAAIAHVLPMIANSRDWQTLIRGANRPTVSRMLHLVWIRESVNSMLPVARIGGEVVSFRLMTRGGLRPSTAAASIIVDMQLTVISQLIFTLGGIAYLVAQSSSSMLRLGAELALGAAILAPFLILFALVQHASPFERMAGLVNRLCGGQLAGLVGQSGRIDQSIKLIWRRRSVILRYVFFWQPVQCLLTALELWLALYFLGVTAGFQKAIVLELLIQAVSSAAFFVPGALGIQEGGFVLIGGALGFDPATSLALAGSRRIRDVLVFLPGLVAWQVAETSGAYRRPVVP
jgi:putative membrane protein